MPDVWTLVDHACRTCFGRVVEADGLFRCTGCGAQASGSPESICGCGVLPGPMAKRVGDAGARFRCGPNPRRGPDSPAEIVVLFGDPPAPEAAAAA